MTDQLAAFAPRRLLDHGLLATGGSWTETATTLFVDLEGFTSMTERLGAFGSRGTEELSLLLRGFFGAITDAVTDHGGDPIAFGGDALTVLFDGPARSALKAATSAAAAIDRLVEETSGATTLAGPLQLRTRIGVARGPVTTSVARASERSLPVHLGRGLELAAAAESTAAPGEVVVHPSALDVTSNDPDPYLAPTGSRAAAAGLAQLASPWVADRIKTGKSPLESHRRITAAFAKFPAVPAHGMPDFLTVVADLLELVTGWEGEVVQVAGGDKGIVAMVVFGVPLAHPDDPMRAVEAMLRLRDHEPALAAGVATGPVFAAVLGSRSRLFLTHTGLAVTTAARLMQGAHPEELLVDGGTWAESCGRLRQRGEPLTQGLKGHRDEVDVHAVEGWQRARPSAVAEARPPLIGRPTEVAAIEALLDAAAAGTGRALAAQGEPGIGKTRLAEEAVDRATTRGFRVAATDVDAHPRNRPQTLWRELLGRILDVPGTGGSAQWRAALSACLPEARGQAGLLGPLVGLPLDRPAVSGRPDTALETELAQGLVAKLLAVVSSRRPTLVVVDNVDHLDDGARRFVSAVATRLAGSKTSLLTTTVKDPLDMEILRLLELSAEDAGVVAADAWRHIGGGGPPPWLESETIRRAGGNPLYVRTVVSALHHAWQPGSPPPHLHRGPEGGLAALLNERVDRLDGTERELIHLLAVMRRPCDADVIVTASDELDNVRAVKQVAGRLVGQRLVAVDHADGVERISLMHDVVRQAIYDSLSHAQREQLHSRLVESLERRGADALEIVEHVRELDDPGLRRTWFPRAAAAARHAWNFPEAVRYLEQVRPLVTGPDRERIEVELLEVMLVAGRANDVLAEANEPGPDIDTQLATRRLQAIAEAAYICGDFQRSERAALQAMELTDGRDEVSYQRAGDLLVLVRSETGDTRGAVTVGERLLDRAKTVRDPRAVATARAALGVALLRSGMPDQAARHYRQALKAAREVGDVVMQVHVLSDLAGCGFETGDYAECTRLLSEARTLADGIGYRRHLAFNLANEAQLRASLGDPFAAACAATAITRCVEMGDLTAAANALQTWLSASPESEASLDHWRRLAQLDADLGRRLAAAGDSAALSVVAARAGRPQEALRAAASADVTARELGQPRLQRRARLGRLLASRPTNAPPSASFLAKLEELAGDPDASGVERAEIALQRWRATRAEADRGSAFALATKAFEATPSAVVRAWFDELGEPTPEPPSPLPPPIGITASATTLADLDEAFTQVEIGSRAHQPSK